MEERVTGNRVSKKLIYRNWLILISICTVINVALSRFVSAFNLPVYLDCVGTILSGALGGFIPGIMVGFLSNLIGGLSDPVNTYYGVLNVLIAVASAWFCRKKAFWHFPQILFVIAVFAVIGGCGGSVLTWFLYGGGFGEGISSSLAHYFFDNLIHNVFWSQLLADMIIDIPDKAISVVIVSAILLALPEKVHLFFDLDGWREGYDSSNGKADLKGGISLQKKLIFLISAAVCLSSGSVAAISIKQYLNSTIAENGKFALDMANYVAMCIDGDRVDEYIKNGKSVEGYKETEDNLRRLWESSENIQFIYAYRILEDGCHVVFDLDTPELEGGLPGELVEFDEAFSDSLPALLRGEAIEPVVSNETYGWLLTAYVPVYDSNGVCQCYAAVDLSMPALMTSQGTYVAKILSLFLGFFTLILAVGIYLARHNVIIPINSMARVAGDFAYSNDQERENTIEKLKELDIDTGDEIENLYRALLETTEETARYIDQTQEKNETISKLQNGMIVVMADLVESRDKYTGTHVKHTAAYVKVIMERMKKDGIYADQITDELIQDVVDSAPLHDIGKIRIPDAILNKPGKLTDEEFARMKEHTSIGAEILDNAMDTLRAGSTGYLKEARNLAQSHHEKWNGKGYPAGLSGEDIPLSARIMAVADVFDALVSKRSYKEGMPVEKAMSIITNDSGSHFDPNVIRAFVESEDELRAIALTGASE